MSDLEDKDLEACEETSQIICELYKDKILKTPKTINFISPDEIDRIDYKMYENMEELSEPECYNDSTIRDIIKSNNESDDDEESDDEDEDNSQNVWPNLLDRAKYQFQENYTIVKELMNSRKRKVFAGFRNSDKLEIVIILAKDSQKKQRINGVPREIRCFNRVRGHENVCELLGWKILDSNNYAMLLRYHIQCNPVTSTNGNLTAISKYMKGLLEGLLHLKNNNVCHRDIAKDNVLWDPVACRAVITDFDNSCISRHSGYYRNVGRDNYDAPEKLKVVANRSKEFDIAWDTYHYKYERHGSKDVKRRYKFKRHRNNNSSYEHKIVRPYRDNADVYSAGIIMWMLINGEPESPERKVVDKWLRRVKRKRLHRDYPEIDLLISLLAEHPKNRISIEDALNHSFIKMEPEMEHNIIYMGVKETLFEMDIDINKDTNICEVEDVFLDTDGDDDIDYDTKVSKEDVPSESIVAIEEEIKISKEETTNHQNEEKELSNIQEIITDSGDEADEDDDEEEETNDKVNETNDKVDETNK